MSFREYEDLRRTHLPVVKSGGKVCGASIRRPLSALIILALLQLHLPNLPKPRMGRLQFQRLLAASPCCRWWGTLSGQFGTMNALGHRNARHRRYRYSSQQRRSLPYTLSNNIFPGLPNPHRGAVTAFVNSNFTHPAALIMQSCPSSSACNASGNFSAISLLAGPPPR